MEAQQLVQGQKEDQQQWQQLAANDPDYRIWHNNRQIEDELAFEKWLDTTQGQIWLNKERESDDEKFLSWLESPEGSAWLDYQFENHLESLGLTYWKFDGFNPPCSYA